MNDSKRKILLCSLTYPCVDYSNFAFSIYFFIFSNASKTKVDCNI